MKKILCLLAVSVGTCAASVYLSTLSEPVLKPNHHLWMQQNYKEISAIKIGMTRADLLQVCSPDMGLSTRTQGRYVYRGSPLIKLEVEFEAAGLEDGSPLGQPQDRIVKISRPFLE